VKAHRRRLREAYRDFVCQHWEISDEIKSNLWKWLMGTPEMMAGLDYRVPARTVLPW
jgi:hypothetical protein